MAKDTDFIFGTHDHMDSPHMTPEKDFETVRGANSSKMVKTLDYEFVSVSIKHHKGN